MQENLTAQGGAVSFDNKENIKDQLHKGNFGIEGDLGLVIDAGKSRIFVEGGGNYGFLNIQKGTENGKKSYRCCNCAYWLCNQSEQGITV